MKKVNKSDKELDVVFLLDRSGSMSGMEQDTIGGYNSYLNKQRNNTYSTKITTVLFDNEYELLHNRTDIKDVKDLTSHEYYVRGCTALLDAIGKTINELSSKVGENKVLFVITTDGLENASREYTKEKIKSLISSHPHWEFLYIGANIDSYAEGASIGIRSSNISNYCKTKKGTKNLFSAIDKATTMMYECASLNEEWKEELDSQE